MKKIINDPKQVVEEMLQGMVKSYPDYLKRIPETGVVYRTDLAKIAGKVGIVSGGGSGHEPAHAGFVGAGMLSAAVCGEVFTSPTPDQIFEAIKQVNSGAGVFLVIKNYSGDVMNLEMAQDMAEMEEIPVKSIVVDDDVAVENSTYTQGRRGVAGTILMHKILGAAADQGASLDEIADLATAVLPNLKTVAVALSGATVPEVGKPGFVLADDEIEYGVGIHGEPGYRREKLQPSKKLANELIEKLRSEFRFRKGDAVAVLVNGMGATPLMEQYVFMNDVLDQLAEEGLRVRFSKVGNLMTSLDMAGVSLTILKIKDDWVDKLNYATHTIAW
ncbi:dihydroxyacetone kinase subunit DhaK [Pediococcus acidilactici]|uniref:phosphoenolpyruvate--glycerone phosphotransferase n=1 Tax=Pediococcus acidilactici TaxID=1254 RepID=A0AAW8YKP9_PEDAC|nr:dihydroxyacetone kinase subunit DhaK [Pediococcus acidilactici]MDV2910368.1 dihydroxyacetone kinase subunit DhaK [Pediococcus acidilactici]WQS16614.1 dihydroxyacetone kinase subunit DhaK [Pediococcus acidilactici]